jgi:hypothetical protein
LVIGLKGNNLDEEFNFRKDYIRNFWQVSCVAVVQTGKKPDYHHITIMGKATDANINAPGILVSVVN